jgi:hypothetical protein
MKKTANNNSTRRKFIRTSAGIISGYTLFPHLATGDRLQTVDGIHIIGPREGYSPQVGTLVSMITWMQDSLLGVIKGLTEQEIDYLHDRKSNTIGALLLHIAAIEVIYQDMTFYGQKEFSESNKKKWSVAMNLGEHAQQQIKGNQLDFYLTNLQQVRQKTLSELQKRDDEWLARVDPSFFDEQPTNNYCKWFHVCEHIANHRGQITWIRKRLPAPKAGKN